MLMLKRDKGFVGAMNNWNKLQFRKYWIAARTPNRAAAMKADLSIYSGLQLQPAK